MSVSDIHTYVCTHRDTYVHVCLHTHAHAYSTHTLIEKEREGRREGGY